MLRSHLMVSPLLLALVLGACGPKSGKSPEAAAAGVRIGVDSGGLDVELGGPGGVGLGLDLDDGIGADVSVGGGGLGVSIGGGGGVSLNLGLGGLL